MAVTATSRIRVDERGVAWIDDTKTKVVEVALDMIAHGWSPEEIHFQHSRLSLGQIHAALVFTTTTGRKLMGRLSGAGKMWRRSGKKPASRQSESVCVRWASCGARQPVHGRACP